MSLEPINIKYEKEYNRRLKKLKKSENKIMKCYKMNCSERPIIQFEYKVHKDNFCLEHLVERIEYIKENKLFHLITEIKKIIPIYNF